MTMAKKTKAFSTYEQQLNILEHDKHLIITNRHYAIRTLEQLGYFSLIGGYKSIFKDVPPEHFIRGVTFEEIVSFYYFDEELRTLFMKYILHVERHIKSLFSYCFCEKYGKQQKYYLDVRSYNYTGKNAHQIQKLVHSLEKAISLPSQYPYINHAAESYHNVPLWIAVNALTFGQISKMYQYATTDIRSKVSKNFPCMNEKQLHLFITVVSRCRNICAHGERLFAFRIHETIPDTPLHKKLQIPQKNGNYVYGKHDLFAVVIALRYLISHDEFKAFRYSLGKLIRKVLCECPHITEEKLLRTMGFPGNWEKICRYRMY